MNFDLLRPVVFADLKVGDTIRCYSGMKPIRERHVLG